MPIDHKFKLYLVVNTQGSHSGKLYPLFIMQEYEIHTHEEIELDEAMDTLETLYPRMLDINGDIYFRAAVIE